MNIRRTKEQASQTKQLIFKSALAVFYKKGYSATTLEDIAKEAQLSRGAIYWNFKNKHDLYVTLLREYFYENIHCVLLSQVDNCDNSLDALKQYLHNYLYILINDQEIRNFMEIIRYKTEVKTDLNEVLEVQQEMDMTIKSEIATLVKKGITSNEIRNDIDESTIIMAATSYLNGIEDTWLINTEAFDLLTHLDNLIKIFIDSIRKKSLPNA